MKQIRHRVFETNSSSTHSLSVSSKDAFVEMPYIKNKIIDVEFGEFGWGYERLNSLSDRLSYLITDLMSQVRDVYNMEFDESKNKFLNYKYYLWTQKAVKKYVGNNFRIDWDKAKENKYYNFGYIDHQSADTHIIGKRLNGSNIYVADILYDFWSDDEDEFIEKITGYIFNNKYTLIIDNDNH